MTQRLFYKPGMMRTPRSNIMFFAHLRRSTLSTGKLIWLLVRHDILGLTILARTILACSHWLANSMKRSRATYFGLRCGPDMLRCQNAGTRTTPLSTPTSDTGLDDQSLSNRRTISTRPRKTLSTYMSARWLSVTSDAGAGRLVDGQTSVT